MPRIRKKTSKRVSISKREKVKKRVKETRKKKSKEAKKNPQWKSKHAKDPGIPNNFPYKDQILAEVAEQRRLAAEEKQRRKDEKKAAKASQAAEGSDAEDEVAFDGVKSIAARRALAGVEDADGDEDQEMEGGEGEDEVPVLISPDLPNLKVVLDAADVVVEVLDARDPLSVRSSHLEEVAKELGKKVLLVLNKVDACPRESVEAWATTLRQEHPTVLFRSSSACLPVSPADAARGKGKGKERERADDAWGLNFLTSLLQKWATDKESGESLTLAVVGVTNVGKTSFVNSLLRKATLPTYKLTSSANDFTPTTTTHPQEVTIDLEGGRLLRVIDTPGLLWRYAEDLSDEEVARIRARDILSRNRGHIERLKDPSAVMAQLVSRSSREDLMLMYNLPIFLEGDANAFLASVARANGFIKKKGDPDLAVAARTVLRDWSSGKFARYTAPSPSPSPPPASPSDAPSDKLLADVYAKDASVLSKLVTRKELRKAGGLVKLRTGEVDSRKVVLEAGYFVSLSDDGSEADEVGLDEDEESEGDEEEGSDDDEDDDEDEEDKGEQDEDDEEESIDELESPPPRGKRKRVTLAEAHARPAKRVAFAPEPKGTKQARSAAGAKGATTAASKEKAKANKPKPKSTKKPLKAAAKVAPKAAAPARKVANAAPSKKNATSTVKDGEVAYDFKQFF